MKKKKNECSSTCPCPMLSLLLGYNPRTTSSIHDLLTSFSLAKIFFKVRESRNQALCIITIFMTTEMMWVISVHPLGFHIPVSKSIPRTGFGSIVYRRPAKAYIWQRSWGSKSEMKYWAGLLEESSYRKEKNFGFRGVCVCNVKFNGATFYQDYKWLSVKLYQFTKKKSIKNKNKLWSVCVWVT